MNASLSPKKFQKAIFIVLVILFVACNEKSSYNYPFQNPKLNVDERVNDLVSRMTLEEKADQLLYDAPAIERLGVPSYNWWNECLHGVARAGKATVFPQAIGLAATFDTVLMSQIGIVVSDEARAKYHKAVSMGNRGIYQGLTFWTPNINIFRDPRWGRGMETYGEDPFLTSGMAVSFIKSLQGNNPNYFKVIATAKHFVVHSGPEPSRHSFDALVTDRDLLDTYLPHFKATIEQANVQSVMCAYNRVNGEPCCGSNSLLNELLRNQWNFKGYIVSDCWALMDFHNGHNVTKDAKESAALALNAGTDLNCGVVYKNLLESLQAGLITEESINQSVKRLFKARFQLGMFDSDSLVPYAQIPYSVVASKDHHQLAVDAAKKSMVLLKNKDHTLPFGKNLKTIAVLGPNANDEEVLLANYNGFPEKAITPLQGITEKVGGKTKVIYARGCDLAENTPSLVPIPTEMLFTDSTLINHGLNAGFYNNTTFLDKPVAQAIHPQVDFNWWEEAPVEQVGNDNFSIRWLGYFVPKISGEYYLGADATDYYQMVLDGDTLLTFESPHGNIKKYKKIALQAGKKYPLTLSFKNYAKMAKVQLLWSPPAPTLLADAVNAARSADAVVLCLGLSPRLEGEEMEVAVEGFAGGDRITLGLPKTQLHLMKEIIKLNKPTVLVLLNGSAVAINWEKEHIPAILEAWYPGEGAGTAIADVLFGDYNPSGRLPVTFYKSENDIPDFNNYSMTGRTYRYFEKEPLYEFGYGLSYTTFKYSTLSLSSDSLSATNGFISATVTINNTGDFDGEEVVQLYLKSTLPERPIKELKGFIRIFIKKGESATVSFEIGFDQLATMDNQVEASVKSGEYWVMIGGSSSDKNLQTQRFIVTP